MACRSFWYGTKKASLEEILLGRKEKAWPIALFAMFVVLMVLQTLGYHAAKRPYHHAGHDDEHSQDYRNEMDEHTAEASISNYASCSFDYHTGHRLDNVLVIAADPIREQQGAGGGDTGQNGAQAWDLSICNARKAIQQTNDDDYLERKAQERLRKEDDMAFFFGRFIARLLVVQI
jgi:hypothetical protein